MSFQRYLSAKRTVDDRALNRRVEDRLADEIEGRESLNVLEVGAGIGATVERLLASEWLPDRVGYTALDYRPENVAAARERLPARAAARGYAVSRAGGHAISCAGGHTDACAGRHADARTGERAVGRARDPFVLSRGTRRVEVEFVAADAFEYLAAKDAEWDLLIAHAFVDLVDPADALAAFRDALAPGGVAYCPITFDGGTVFEPVADRAFEDHLTERFHRHLDQSGDSKAGRRLLSLATETGEVLAAGGSDWVVRPRGDDYPADEAYFLHYVVDLVGGAVREDPAVDDRRLGEWTDRRHDQVDDAELVYCAHQLDLLVR